METNRDGREIAIQLSGVKKMYKLGQIGGGTLQGDLQSWWARIRGKEDPNTKIGQEQRLVGQNFMALNGIDLTVYKGEAIGIIGGNGAGKSTMLKILSRVTAPTEGTIDIYGRVASMLEVGTGFNGEMTGRENIYMNGAILGMTKSEIDAKMDDIIEFSEVKDFIDTPVKRYSSGMYVKLAFAVAAHLDSEIMIMDEVLAVGDMKFQQKCLGKMENAATCEGRTVLYVSHNMSTIRQLCTKCIVLEHGKVSFIGDTEEAIAIYLNSQTITQEVDVDLSEKRMRHLPPVALAKMTRFRLLNQKSAMLSTKEKMIFELTVNSNINIENLLFRFELRYIDDTPVGVAQCAPLGKISEGEIKAYKMAFDTSLLVRGKYKCLFVIYSMNEFGTYDDYDAIMPAYVFEISDDNTINWDVNHWGHVQFPDIELMC